MQDHETVLFDVDGTIADLHTVWVARYNKLTGNNNTVEDITEWYIPSVLPDLSHDEHFEIISNPYIYADVEPYPGAVDFVNYVRKSYQIGFVSHCPYQTVESKFFWLKRFGFTHDFDEFLPMNTHFRRVLAKNVVAIYDDRTATLEGLDNGWLVDRPWNMSDKYERRVSAMWHGYLNYNFDIVHVGF